MSSPDCGLPNVDIFDPVQCTKRWNQCATQQQINVYLNSEIVRTQECLQLFKTAQHGVNDILDGKIRNHETRITALETAQATLTEAQNKLNADFIVIQAQNTAYQTSVDNTLKLYQESINAITTTTNTLATEQQKLWNEINALKGSIDVSKINEALAGYDAIMSQTKELIAANNAELQIQFKGLETKFNTLESELNNSLSDSEAALSKRFNTLSKTLTADIEAQNIRINNLVNSTSASIADLQAQISASNSEFKLSVTNIQKELKSLHEEMLSADSALGERIAAEEQARKDGDECLKGQIKASDAINAAALATLESKVTSDINALDKKVTDEINTFETNTDLKLLQIQNDLRNSQDTAIANLDAKLSAEIKSVESTLSKEISELEHANDLEHDEINARIDDVEEELAGGVDKRIADAVKVVDDRVTEVEQTAHEENEALEASLTKELGCLDNKLSLEIKTVELELSNDINDLAQTNEADHKVINGRLDVLEVEIGEGVDLRIEEAVTVVNDRVTEVEKTAHTENEELEARLNKSIDGVDSKLTTEIKSVETELEKELQDLTYTNAAEHKAINDRIDGFDEAVTTGVDERIAEAVSIVNTRITNVESNAQDANDALEKRLTKTITDGLSEATTDLSELSKRVDTQGELIQASRDESTLAWRNEIKDRIAGDEALKAEIAALDIEGVKAQIADDIKKASDNLQLEIDVNSEEIEKLKVSDAKQWTTINNTVETTNQMGERVTKLEQMGGSGYDDTEVKALIEVNKLNIEKAESHIEDLDLAIYQNEGDAKGLKYRISDNERSIVGLDTRVKVLEDAGGVSADDYNRACYDLTTLFNARAVVNHAFVEGQTLEFINRDIDDRKQSCSLTARIIKTDKDTGEKVSVYVNMSEEFCGFVTGSESTVMQESGGLITCSSSRNAGDSSVFQGTIWNKVSRNYSVTFTVMVTADRDILVHMSVNTEYTQRDKQTPAGTFPETTALTYDGSRTYDGSQTYSGKVK